MADYHSPTVVRPTIPASAIAPLELLILGEMFESERDGDAFYFYSSDGPSGTVYPSIKLLKEYLADYPSPSSSIAVCVREQLESLPDGGVGDEGEIDLDLSDLGDGAIFQEIVRRSEELDHVTITSAWTCSKMRPDGFGGGVTVITADHILSASTNQMECELLDRAEYGELGCAPGHGSHILLRLSEADIRSAIDAIVGAGIPASAEASNVTDEDIRIACRNAAEAANLTVRHDDLATVAARAAIEIARQRNA